MCPGETVTTVWSSWVSCISLVSAFILFFKSSEFALSTEAPFVLLTMEFVFYQFFDYCHTTLFFPFSGTQSFIETSILMFLLSMSSNFFLIFSFYKKEIFCFMVRHISYILSFKLSINPFEFRIYVLYSKEFSYFVSAFLYTVCTYFIAAVHSQTSLNRLIRFTSQFSLIL